MKVAADEGLDGRARRRRVASRSGFARWVAVSPGYQTPKVAVGAAVTNDEGELLLIRRADSGFWLYPTGWCDVGYSAPEVVVKEVLEETGIEVEPVRLIGGARRHAPRRRRGSRSTRCSSSAAPSAASCSLHPLEVTDAGWFIRDALPSPTIGAERWAGADLCRDRRRGARRLLRRPAPTRLAGRVDDRHGREGSASRRPNCVEGLNRLLPQLSSSAPTLTLATTSRRWSSSESTTLFVATDGGAIVGTLTLVIFRIPTGLRAWIEDVVVDEDVRGLGVGEALTIAAVEEARSRGARSIDLTSRPSREAANAMYLKLGFERRDTNVYRLGL